MHTLIQELRGNVRVFARIRPYLPNDGKRNDDNETPDIVSLVDDRTVTVLNPKDSRQQSHKFSFDRVFSPSDGQEAVFEEVSEFVHSALDGYNVCIFSYGQTGSG
jgi:kinesin family protein C1